MKKTQNGQAWTSHEEVLAEAMPTWQERRIMSYGNDVMCVENKFEVGDTAPVHSHYHSQISYIVSGEFRFEIGEETRILKTGDSAYMAPDVVHRAECIKPGIILDVFAPMREDFVE